MSYLPAPTLPTLPACHKLQTRGEGKIANKFKSLWAELGKYSSNTFQQFFQTKRFNLSDGISSPYLLFVLWGSDVSGELALSKCTLQRSWQKRRVLQVWKRAALWCWGKCAFVAGVLRCPAETSDLVKKWKKGLMVKGEQIVCNGEQLTTVMVRGGGSLCWWCSQIEVGRHWMNLKTNKMVFFHKQKYTFQKIPPFFFSIS